MEIVGRFTRNKPSQDRVGLVFICFGKLDPLLSHRGYFEHSLLSELPERDDASFNPGTNIGRAIQNGFTILSRDAELYPQVARKKRVFILISDGEDHGDELESAVREASRQSIRIHTIGIGSLEGAPFPLGGRTGAPLRGRRERNKILTASMSEACVGSPKPRAAALIDPSPVRSLKAFSKESSGRNGRSRASKRWSNMKTPIADFF